MSSPFGISVGNDALFVVQNGNDRLSRYDGNLLSLTDETSTSIGFNVYPNPNAGEFRFTDIGNTIVLETEIYDLAGKRVAQITQETPIIENTLVQLNLQAGTYIAAIRTDQGTIQRKIVIR